MLCLVLSVSMLNDTFFYCYAEFRYAVCCFAECHGATRALNTFHPLLEMLD